VCSGRADVIHLSRDKQGGLKVLIADIKASRKEKTEHRLQVAIYARMIQTLAKDYQIPLADIRGTILTKQDNGSYPTLGPDTPTFDLDTYLSILDRLVVHEDAVVTRG
jgi:predicted RecB family nuclease